MHHKKVDDNLLFAVLAFQNGLVTQETFLTALNAWLIDKSKPLREHLVAIGRISPDEESAIQSLCLLHLARNGSDIENSLASLTVHPDVRSRLLDCSDKSIARTAIHLSDTKGSRRTQDPLPQLPGNLAQIVSAKFAFTMQVDWAWCSWLGTRKSAEKSR